MLNILVGLLIGLTALVIGVVAIAHPDPIVRFYQGGRTRPGRAANRRAFTRSTVLYLAFVHVIAGCLILSIAIVEAIRLLQNQVE